MSSMKSKNKNTYLSYLINTSLLLVIILINTTSIFAQIAINNTNSAPHPAAVLDITSTEKGILIPRMSATERMDIEAPANGLLVYQNEAPRGFYFFHDNTWSLINKSASAHPIGSIIDWWRPNAGFPIPEGYVICDGTAISNVLSPLNGNLTPDFTDKYVLGTSDWAEAGQSGGNLYHNHTVNANANSAQSFNHSHTFDYKSSFLVSTRGDHNHATLGQSGSTDFDSHDHIWASYNGANKNWSSFNASGNPVEMVDWGDGMDSGGTGHFPIQINNSDLNISASTSNNNHNHTYTIPAGLLSSTDGAHTHHAPGGLRQTSNGGSHFHEYTMGDVLSTVGENHPKYVGLLKLMRIY